MKGDEANNKYKREREIDSNAFLHFSFESNSGVRMMTINLIFSYVLLVL